VIKKPHRRGPRPDLGFTAIGWMDGWMDEWNLYEWVAFYTKANTLFNFLVIQIENKGYKHCEPCRIC
jgi:hypothetical protein